MYKDSLKDERVLKLYHKIQTKNMLQKCFRELKTVKPAEKKHINIKIPAKMEPQKI